MLLALLLPRLALSVALAAQPQPQDVPVAVGPQPFGEPRIGLPSAIAEASGVRSGMRLGVALTLCPELVLVPPDPVGVQLRAAQLIREIAAMGLPVEEIGSGRALVAAEPGLRLYGGPQRLLQRLHDVAPDEALQIGAAPSRFSALMAARLARHRPRIFGHDDVQEMIAPLSVVLLHEDGGTPAEICEALNLVGIDRLGGLASLNRLAVRDRFGPEGVRAWQMARGEDGDAITPNKPPPLLRAELVPGEPIATDHALEQAIDLLLTRLLKDPTRGTAEPRLLRLQAYLVTGESWICEAPLREPCGNQQRLFLALLPKARRLPAPAERIAISFAELAPGAHQLALLDPAGVEREQRLDGAAAQVRSALGAAALLRVVTLDPTSRLPERRYGLTAR
ncbi:MAG: hypothetical protein EXQ67_02000 [Thermoleophilia bacterium]|nr:hypothetical protein [Thermoleophilia bacterium]